MDITPRISHRVQASHDAMVKAIQAQLSLTVNDTDRSAVFTGASMALFEAIYRTWRGSGVAPDESALKALLWWKGMGENLATFRDGPVKLPANDAPPAPRP